MEIVIIGSGNLATQLGLALTDAGLHIRQVYSRTAEHAKQLADKIGAGYTANIDEIDENADVYIMSVKDDAISEIASKVCAKSSDAVLLHTAGSISIEIFKGKALENIEEFDSYEETQNSKYAKFYKIAKRMVEDIENSHK